MGEIKVGDRKVVLTQWMLVIFSIGTLGYFILLGLNSQAPPDSFFMNFVLGLGAIGGAFTAGNIFENRAKAALDIEKERNSENAVKISEAQKEKARAHAESEKAKVGKS